MNSPTDRLDEQKLPLIQRLGCLNPFGLTEKIWNAIPARARDAILTVVTGLNEQQRLDKAQRARILEQVQGAEFGFDRPDALSHKDLLVVTRELSTPLIVDFWEFLEQEAFYREKKMIFFQRGGAQLTEPGSISVCGASALKIHIIEMFREVLERWERLWLRRLSEKPCSEWSLEERNFAYLMWLLTDSRQLQNRGLTEVLTPGIYILRGIGTALVTTIDVTDLVIRLYRQQFKDMPSREQVIRIVENSSPFFFRMAKLGILAFSNANVFFMNGGASLVDSGPFDAKEGGYTLDHFVFVQNGHDAASLNPDADDLKLAATLDFEALTAAVVATVPTLQKGVVDTEVLLLQTGCPAIKARVIKKILQWGVPVVFDYHLKDKYAV